MFAESFSPECKINNVHHSNHKYTTVASAYMQNMLQNCKLHIVTYDLQQDRYERV